MGRNSNYNRKSGGTGFLITAGIIFLALKGLPGLLLGVAIGAGVGAIASIMGKKLDTTTHNRRDREREAQEAILRSQEEARQKQEELRRKQEEASKIPLTGDPQADNVIMKGQEMLNTIREENIVITDETLSAQMDTLSDKCMQIFRTVSAEPSKAPQVRKFMSYYLPTTLKVLANYRTMQERGVSYYEMNQARESAVRCMDMVLTACQKQIDALHKENMLDISTDIDVMEQMLKRDGYVDNEILNNQRLGTARTAAEAQMRSSDVPLLNFKEAEGEEEPPAPQAARTID
ncbi:MAG: 5-bromo-4-chloroindolyl phosphate hydrolysis family protein [Clostridia bacterium]|nr:5-bromo-4-chloroindolyl phosphate hydrolysis family protein [Clostridia bacterium]